ARRSRRPAARSATKARKDGTARTCGFLRWCPLATLATHGPHEIRMEQSTISKGAQRQARGSGSHRYGTEVCAADLAVLRPPEDVHKKAPQPGGTAGPGKAGWGGPAPSG